MPRKSLDPNAADATMGPMSAEGSMALVKRARALNLHETAFLAYVEGDNALAIRGARNEAVVACLRLAAAPTMGERLFTSKVVRLAGFVAVLEEPLRSYVADLIDGALTADAAARVAARSAPAGRGFPGRMAPAMDGPTPSTAWSTPTADHLASYAARAGAGDPDHVLLTVIAIIRGMCVAPSGIARTEAGYDDLERAGFALCAAVPASRAERDDGRRIVVLLWLALRRRRPLAAAILRTKLRLDRIRLGARGPCG